MIRREFTFDIQSNYGGVERSFQEDGTPRSEPVFFQVTATDEHSARMFTEGISIEELGELVKGAQAFIAEYEQAQTEALRSKTINTLNGLPDGSIVRFGIRSSLTPPAKWEKTAYVKVRGSWYVSTQKTNSVAYFDSDGGKRIRSGHWIGSHPVQVLYNPEDE